MNRKSLKCQDCGVISTEVTRTEIGILCRNCYQEALEAPILDNTIDMVGYANNLFFNR